MCRGGFICFDLQGLKKLGSLPPGFFRGQSQLEQMDFIGSTALGNDQRLPNDFFNGLTSLETLELSLYSQGGVQTLPNMDDLTALTSITLYASKLHMNDNESEAQFDGLVSAETINLAGNALTRVPSLKNLTSLRSLWLQGNRITKIFAGDFAGAVKLVVISLGGNIITSVAPNAFARLTYLRVTPQQFNATNFDGTPYQDAYGVGVWPHISKHGHFGGNESWAQTPISFSPNPVECLWVGPNVNDLNCSRCVLGYEIISEDNATCAKPKFKPKRGWGESKEYSQLQLQLKDTRSKVVNNSSGTSTFTLETGQKYTVPASENMNILSQKEVMFVGYKQPYSKIKYELDFSLGANVDIGCDTSVVGNGAGDPNIPKSNFAHPHSMLEMSFHWPVYHKLCYEYNYCLTVTAPHFL